MYDLPLINTVLEIIQKKANSTYTAIQAYLFICYIIPIYISNVKIRVLWCFQNAKFSEGWKKSVVAKISLSHKGSFYFRVDFLFQNNQISAHSLNVKVPPTWLICIWDHLKLCCKIERLFRKFRLHLILHCICKFVRNQLVLTWIACFVLLRASNNRSQFCAWTSWSNAWNWKMVFEIFQIFFTCIFPKLKRCYVYPFH